MISNTSRCLRRDTFPKFAFLSCNLAVSVGLVVDKVPADTNREHAFSANYIISAIYVYLLIDRASLFFRRATGVT